MSLDDTPVYLHYLDLQTARPAVTKGTAQQETRLRYDILAFPNRRLVVAAPAFAKCTSTIYLASAYAELWTSSRMRYALSEKHGGSMKHYTNIRMAKLERSMPEQLLSTHFEFRGYQSKHWRVFFDDFLVRHLRVANGCQNREDGCDGLFRQGVLSAMGSDLTWVDKLCLIGRQDDVGRVYRVVEGLAQDESTLFQRDLVLATLSRAVGLQGQSMLAIKHLLDCAFAQANAQVCSAMLPGDFTGLDGEKLRYICRLIPIGVRQTLGELIERLPPTAVIRLSSQICWQEFLTLLNEMYMHACAILDDSQSAMQELRRRLWLWPGPMSLEAANMIAAYVLGLLIAWLFGGSGLDLILGSLLTSVPGALVSALCSNYLHGLLVATHDVQRLLRTFQRVNGRSEYEHIREYFRGFGIEFAA